MTDAEKPKRRRIVMNEAAGFGPANQLSADELRELVRESDEAHAREDEARRRG